MANRYLTLPQHLEMLGIGEKGLQQAAWDIQIEKGVLLRALRGLPISAPDAQAICRWLSRKHDIAEKDGFVPGDIPGLQVWKSHLQ